MALDSGYFGDDRTGEMANASSVEQTSSSKLEYAGTYRMKVVSKKFKKKDGDVIEFPNLKPTGTKSLGLNFILETVDSTKEVPAGSSAYGMIVIAPAPGASAKKVKDTMKFAKPRLAALLGPDKMAEFKFDEEWITTNLTAEFEKVRGKDEWKLVDDHSMQNEVMVTFVVGEYQGQAKLNIKSIKAAVDGDVSVTTGGNINDEPDAFDDPSSDDLDSIDGLSDATADGVVDEEQF